MENHTQMQNGKRKITEISERQGSVIGACTQHLLSTRRSAQRSADNKRSQLMPSHSKNKEPSGKCHALLHDANIADDGARVAAEHSNARRRNRVLNVCVNFPYRWKI